MDNVNLNFDQGIVLEAIYRNSQGQVVNNRRETYGPTIWGSDQNGVLELNPLDPPFFDRCSVQAASPAINGSSHVNFSIVPTDLGQPPLHSVLQSQPILIYVVNAPEIQPPFDPGPVRVEMVVGTPGPRLF